MKILHVGPLVFNKSIGYENSAYGYYDLIGADGPSRVMLSLCDELSKLEGYDVGILSTKRINIDNKILPSNVKFLKSYEGWKYRFIINSKKWMKVIEEQFGVPQIVNFHGVYDIFSVMLAKEMYKKGWPYFVTPHGGLRPVAQNRDRLKKIVANSIFFNRFILESKFIHALTIEEKIDIKKYDNNISDVRLGQSGLPIEFKKIYLKKPKIENKVVTIGFLGSLFVKIKGIDRLLRAILKFQKTFNKSDLKFRFIGPLKNASDQLIIDSYLKQMVKPELLEFLGPKFGKEKWHELQDLDVFILPSRTEGMPIVVLEALAYGKPIIVSDGTNMGRFIKDGNCGWHINGSSDSIYDTLIEIVQTEKSTLKEYGKNAKLYFENQFLMDKSAKDYTKMLDLNDNVE